jgi:hypothetical protein
MNGNIKNFENYIKNNKLNQQINISNFLNKQFDMLNIDKLDKEYYENLNNSFDNNNNDIDGDKFKNNGKDNDKLNNNINE